MFDIRPHLDPVLTEEGLAFLDQALAALVAKGEAQLPFLWPQLARRVGRVPLKASRVEHDDDIIVDLSAWRACDAAGLALLQRTSRKDEMLLDLYLRGDKEEKTIVLRCMAFLPVTPATVRLFGEVQRTNTAQHFEALALDSNLAVRALHVRGDESGFTRDDFHRLVLKMAFLDLPAWRMFRAVLETDETLAGMLQAYATEREAAGRSVWVDTNRFLGRAPVPGSVARILGGLEHGDDATRLAAAEGLFALKRPDLAPYAKERLEREPREVIRRLLRRIAEA